MIKKSFAKKYENGQMMLLSVLILASVIATITALATLLISFQLRGVTDAEASGQAIFAADTGIECILFREFGTKGVATTCPNPDEEVILPNRSKYAFSRLPDVSGNPTWVSVGRDKNGRVARALQITFVKK